MQTPGATPFTPQQEAILLSLSQGAGRTTACHAARLSRRALYDWIEHDPDFARAVEEAEARAIAVLEDLLFKCAMKATADPRYLESRSFWLKHRTGRPVPDPIPHHGPTIPYGHGDGL